MRRRAVRSPPNDGLSELEHSAEEVTLTTDDAALEVRGHTAVVAGDHCIVEDRDGPRLHIPISQISLVIRPRPDL